jgi:hypothetical protein
VPGAQSTRLAVAASVCAVAALAGIAPRVSVAHAALPGRRMTFVREITAAERARLDRDTMIVFRSATRRLMLDSLVRRTGGAAAGGVVGRAEVFVIARRGER